MPKKNYEMTVPSKIINFHKISIIKECIKEGTKAINVLYVLSTISVSTTKCV